MAAMKPRHAAALALVGWYLMLPPLADRSTTHCLLCTGVDAPLFKWTIEDSFDDAMSCRIAIDWRRKNQAQEMKGMSPRGPRPGDAGFTRLTDMVYWMGYDRLTELQFAKCIATDDPRLKEK
jgi:hypothetical protein